MKFINQESYERGQQIYCAAKTVHFHHIPLSNYSTGSNPVNPTLFKAIKSLIQGDSGNSHF